MNPAYSKTIMLVRLENSRLVSVSPFSDVELKIDKECGFHVEKNKLLLLQSSYAISELVKKGFVAEGEVLVRPVEALSSKFVEELIKYKELPSGKPNVFWAFCLSNKECTRAENGCAINTKNLEIFNAYSKNSGNDLCPISRSKSVNLKCEQSFCR